MSTTDDPDTTDEKPHTNHGHYRPDGEEPFDPRGPHALACERPAPTDADDSGNPPQPLSTSQTQFLQKNPTVAFALPDTDEPWRLDTVPFGHSALMDLKKLGLIRRGPRQDKGSRQSGCTYRIWWTKPATARAVAALSEPPTCPEGNYTTGVHCLEAGEVYTCPTDGCDCRFGRNRAEAILSGGGR